MTGYRTRAYVTLLVVSVIWGIATPVIKFTLQGITPVDFLTYRFFIATLAGIFLLLLTAKKHITRLKHNLKDIVLYSVMSTTIALGFLFLGLERTSVLDAVIISSISPLVTALFGTFFLKETITKQEKIGMTIAFLGSIIIILEPLLLGKINTFKLSGNILVVVYLLANAYAAVLSKKLVRKNISSFNLSNISFIIGFLTLLPVALFIKSPVEIVSVATHLPFQYQTGVFYMALVSGTIAYALWIKGQKTIEVSEAGLFAYLNPIFAAPLAVIWLKETLTFPFIIGSFFVALGVFAAEYKKKTA